MKNPILLLSVLLLLFSCNLSEKHSFHSTNKNIVFKIGFPTRKYKNFRSRNNEYIAFIDFSTHKKISINSINGRQINTISFQDLMNTENVSFYGFDIINTDSIVLLSKNTNQVYVLDSLGKQIYKKDYSKLLLKGIDLCPPLKFMHSILHSGTDLSQFVYDSITFKHPFGSKEYGSFVNNFSALFIDSNLFVKKSYNYFKFDSLYSRFTTNQEMHSGTSRFITNNNNLIFYSIYTDSIYIFNKKYQIKSIKKINSDYYTPNLKPLRYDDYMKDYSLTTTNAWVHNCVWKILYDSYNHLYYCFVRGAAIQRKFPFSVIVYNTDFKKLAEKRFSEKIYIPNGFVGKQGLYIEKRNHNGIKYKKFEISEYN